MQPRNPLDTPLSDEDNQGPEDQNPNESLAHGGLIFWPLPSQQLAVSSPQSLIIDYCSVENPPDDEITNTSRPRDVTDNENIMDMIVILGLDAARHDWFYNGIKNLSNTFWLTYNWNTIYQDSEYLFREWNAHLLNFNILWQFHYFVYHYEQENNRLFDLNLGDVNPPSN